MSGPDHITAAARIAAEVAARYGVAVAPSVVQIVPAGKSAEVLPVWNGKALVFPEGSSLRNPLRRAINAEVQRYRGPRETSDVVKLRNARVAALHAEGFTDAEMADALQVSVKLIYRARVALELPVNLAARINTVAQARHKLISDMAAQGSALPAICAAVGLTEDRVRKIGREQFNICWPAVRKSAPAPAPAPGQGVRAQPPQIARVAKPEKPRRVAKSDQCAPLFAKGMTEDQIAAALGVAPKYVHLVLYRAGLVPARVSGYAAKPGGMTLRRAEAKLRRARIAAAYQAGTSLADIAAAESVSDRVFAADLQALNITRPARVAPTAQDRLDALHKAQDERRTAIAALLAKGATVAQLTQQFGISRRTLHRDVAAVNAARPLRKVAKAKIAAQRFAEQRAAFEARVARVRDMAAQGLSREAMAAALPMPVAKLTKLLWRLHLDVPKRSTRPTHHVEGPTAKVLARREQVRLLRAKGLKRIDMAAALNISAATLSEDLRWLTAQGKLADQPALKRQRSRSAKDPQITAQIIDLARTGLAAATIAQRVLLSPGAVAKVIAGISQDREAA